MNKYIAIFPTIVLLLLSSPYVSALAVTDAELHSHLNQQLDARVYLEKADKSDLTSLKIAVREVMDSGEDMPGINCEIKEDQRGHYISLTTKDPIREPVVRFMLELNWSKGHLIREYDLIIDPQ